MYAEEDAGRPFPIIDHCFPTGMPSWMLITHNAFEILFTPGRVTILGEGDGNRLRRIYTDGRPHPADPDPSFHGHSIGHWEQGTLVVDTVALLPQAYLAVSEAVGVPNNGDMHIVERLHLLGPDTLADDLQITRQQGAVQALAHHAQILSAAGPQVRHRRRRLRAGFLQRRRRQERQLDLRAHQVSQRRAGGIGFKLKHVGGAAFQMKYASLMRRSMAAVLAALLGAAPLAVAHHSFAMYEPTKTLTFKCTVKEFQWTNPHTILWVLVQPPGGGAAQEWSLETTSPGVLTRAGWTRHSLKAGDRVSVTLSPLRDGSHGGSLNSVTLLDTGQTLVPSLGKEQPGLK